MKGLAAAEELQNITQIDFGFSKAGLTAPDISNNPNIRHFYIFITSPIFSPVIIIISSHILQSFLKGCI